MRRVESLIFYSLAQNKINRRFTPIDADKSKQKSAFTRVCLRFQISTNLHQHQNRILQHLLKRLQKLRARRAVNRAMVAAHRYVH